MSADDEAPVCADATRVGWLSRLRHDLRTPLNGVIGYSEMLLEDSPAGLPEAFTDGLREVLQTGRQLLASLTEVLSTAGGPPDGHATSAQVGRRLDEVLRRPLELIRARAAGLEDEARVLSREDVRADLGKVREAFARLATMLERAAAAQEPAASPVHPTMAGPRQPDWMAGSSPSVRPEERSAGADQSSSVSGARLEGRTEGAAMAESVELRAEIGHSRAGSDPPARILVVDDNEMNRDVLARRVKREGHEALTACGGAEALRLLRREAIDVVLLDLMMPDMDGDEVLQAMKADLGLRDLPVIMLSALDEMGAVIRCIEMGADDYLPKPFDPVLLRARIRAGLSRRRWRAREVEYLQRIELERDRAEELLRVILPVEVLPELKDTHQVKPRLCEDVAILFCDIVGFTPWCESRQPEEIHGVLQAMNLAFEQVSERHGLQKIKTIGDCFMAAAGLLESDPNPVLSCVRGGLRMVELAPGVLQGCQVRVGIHAGPVIAGVVGAKKYLFDVWGDTVNVAARIESSGLPGTVSVGKEAWDRIAAVCQGESRGMVALKGHGSLEVFRVQSVHEEPGKAVVSGP